MYQNAVRLKMSRKTRGCSTKPAKWSQGGDLAQAAATKHHGLGGLTTEMTVLMVPETRRPRPRCRQVWFLQKPLSLARSPHMAFSLGLHIPAASSRPYKDTSLIRLGPQPEDLISL